jgi:hypothetical protein
MMKLATAVIAASTVVTDRVMSEEFISQSLWMELESLEEF